MQKYTNNLNSSIFFENVYHVVKKIPYGRVTSYGAIAEYLGAKKSSRMVGTALTNSHKSGIHIPAHRVVNRNGLLSGRAHFGLDNEMQKLLESEGIEIKDFQVVAFKELFWNPNTELFS
jgi:methylated-DNA-protein-cysteine methyltransferase-like protein